MDSFFLHHNPTVGQFIKEKKQKKEKKQTNPSSMLEFEA